MKLKTSGHTHSLRGQIPGQVDRRVHREITCTCWLESLGTVDKKPLSHLTPLQLSALNLHPTPRLSPQRPYALPESPKDLDLSSPGQTALALSFVCLLSC